MNVLPSGIFLRVLRTEFCSCHLLRKCYTLTPRFFLCLIIPMFLSTMKLRAPCYELPPSSVAVFLEIGKLIFRV